MRTLVLMRHAKAVKVNESLNDYARPLTEHGRLEAQAQASRLAINVSPEMIIASSALRTCETASIVASFFSKELTLLLKPSLYQAHMMDYFAVVQSLPNEVNTLMIIGHNPSISALCALLAQQTGLELAPSGVCIFQTLTKADWKNLMIDQFDFKRQF